jgi:pescadillo protein
LGEFRRLCILKGIHPREPKKKVHGANKTYYHVKDINFLLHEPLLQKFRLVAPAVEPAASVLQGMHVFFRNIKAYERKIKKAKAKMNTDLAQRLVSMKPGYKIDHLVKERYGVLLFWKGVSSFFLLIQEAIVFNNYLI